MAKRVFIGVGHGGADSGAVGRVIEKEANLTIALELKRLLEANGATAGISRERDEDDDLMEEIRECNAFAPDLAVEIHNNSGGGDGFECYVQTNRYEKQSRAAAKAVEARVINLGQNSRGIKTRRNSLDTADYFGWLRLCKAPAVLLEGFFVDSADAADFDTPDKQKRLALAYARGICDYFGITFKEDNEMRYEKLKDVTSPTYRKTLDKLIAKGIVRGKEGSGEDMILDLGEDAIRILVYLDRNGNFD